MTDFINSHIWNEDEQCFTSELHRRVAEIINDYDPTLFLAWVPPRLREMDEQFPFAIIHQPAGQPQYVVRKLKESEVNEELLAWLWSNDTTKTNVLDRLEALDNARHALKLKEDIERDEELKEFATAVIGSPLHTYRHNGRKYT
jgi:hypothetical protein